MHGRQLLPAGRRITLELAPDHPVEYDAWDLESWTASSVSPITATTSVELVDAASIAGRSWSSRRTLRRLDADPDIHDARRLAPGSTSRFDIDWHEDEQLLSLMVPLDVHTREAVCDIQFGHVMRPTHASSSWDAAKFEVCAHRFVDFSEPSFGVAVLNDGRYGHGVQDGGVRVSLLRAAKYPDPDADHGRHAVTISVLPHGPGLHDVLHEAEALNVPLRVVTGRR